MDKTKEPEVPGLDTPHSINEPPGSYVPPGFGEPTEPPPDPEPIKDEGTDPDELEDEIEDAEDDGDVTIHHRSTTIKKKKK